MPKLQAASQALRAYTRQQQAGLLTSNRPASRPEPPTAAWIGILVKMAAQWVARHAPEVADEQVNREAMALVGDFLSLTPRGPVSHHTYRERFRDYLDGAAAPSEDLEN